ncbi:TIGR04282 family arsenosugar biosynthesis glycosyltransferase [Marinospirillum perlucidum]|uniref:TIGR04282 family arsenosugar biosynthesis glycosyltransferase n=1 Tax=Marinospirillum perlucidum TaxID=1982602 RepID=UPI000DF2F702|nr:TIGR04282 family arsenosugar biosynthesis glycosyltransferase [Marinospirillum perlucidum]
MTPEIAVLARAPVPGQCKTRLLSEFTPEEAAAIQAELTRDTLSQALAADLGPVTLWTAGDSEHPFFMQLLQHYPQLQLKPQPPGDLGQKMHLIFTATGWPCLLLGSDCPVITASLLRQVAEALRQVDAVFLPAEDGGYGLVGLHSPCQGLFNQVPWGSNQVMTETRKLLQKEKLVWSEVASIWDVDYPEDVRRYQKFKEKAEASR